MESVHTSEMSVPTAKLHDAKCQKEVHNLHLDSHLMFLSTQLSQIK